MTFRLAPHPLLRALGAIIMLLVTLGGRPVAEAQETPVSGWFASRQSGDLVYFFFSNPARVERYDLTNRSWLPSLSLPAVRGAATAAGVDADALYVAYDRACYRYSLLAQNEQFLLNTDHPVLTFHSDGNVLLINRSTSLTAYFTSIDKTTNLVIDSADSYINALAGSSIAPSKNKMFGRSIGVSPSDITLFNYTDDGDLTTGGDSPAHGAYPDATRTWVFPNESRVVDDSGTVYSTENLAYLGSLGGRFDDVSFRGGNIPVVLRGRQLTAYTVAFLPAGSASLSANATRIFVAGDDVLAFRRDTTSAVGLAVESMPLSSLSAPLPGTPLDPNGLPFVIDGVWLDKDNQVLILSKIHQTLFRWNPDTQKYGSPIPLLGSPDHGAYSANQHAMYLAYPSGLIRRLDLGGATLIEEPFAQLPAMPTGMAIAGDIVMTADASGAWGTHRTFRPDGTQVSEKEWNYASQEFIWSPPNGRLYHFRDSMSPNDIYWEQIAEDGTIGEQQDSPYHGDFDARHPIRVARDGSRVVIGSGVVFDALTLNRLPGGLGVSFTDGDWGANDTFFWTLRGVAGQTQLQQWNGSTFAPGQTKQWSGHPRRVLAIGADRVLAITAGVAEPTTASIPSFHLWDPSLTLVAPSELSTPGAPVATGFTATSVSLAWSDITGETGYQVDRRQLPDGAWGSLLTTGMSETTATDSSVSNGSRYEYRVTASNGALRSATSLATTVSITPLAPPTGLAASPLGTSGIQLNWNDLNGETGYTIERRVGTSGDWFQLGSMPANAAAYNDYSVSAGLRYHYRIATVNALGTGAWSEPVSLRLPGTVPVAPTWSNPVLAPDSITLYWQAVGGAEDYQIEWKTPAATEWSALVTVPVNGNSLLSHAHTGLPQSTAYQYRVRSRNEDGSSAWSAVRTYSTTSVPPPAAPVLQGLLAGDSGSLKLTWTNVTGEQGYAVERLLDAGWSEVARLSSDVTTYTDANLTNGLTYCYRVRAFNAAPSAYSSTLCAAPSAFACIAEDNFTTGPLPAWTEISGARRLDQVNGLLDGAALWFGLAGPRVAQTHAFDLTSGGLIKFAFRAGNEATDGAAYWNDCEAGEGVRLEWSSDGLTWAPITTIDTTAAASRAWSQHTYSVPAAAQTPTTRLRWRQSSHTGAGFDTWAIDTVCLFAGEPPAPEAPAFLNASASEVSGRAAVILNWPASARSLVYDVERTSDGEDWQAVATGSGHPFFYDLTVTPGSGHGYRVRGRNAGGASPWSPIILIQSLSAEAAWLMAETGIPNPPPALAFTPDATGWPGALRFVFRMSGQSLHTLDAAHPESGGAPLVRRDPATGRLEVIFLRPLHSLSPDLACASEFSSDGIQWSPGQTEEVLDVIDGVWELVLSRDPGTGPARFARVRVWRP